MAQEPRHAVLVRGLRKRYGPVSALDGVDLEVAAGEAFALIGANGAGKTTLIKCLLDLVASDAGRAEIFGVPSALPQARARLAYLPERFVPPHYLLGREFLAGMLALGGERYPEDKVLELLGTLELDRAALAKPVRALSKGMTQKLGLAACFLAARDLYVLDEPMSGLDPAARIAVKGVLRRLSREGRTLLFTSHVLADVDELCGALAVLDGGRVRFRGTPAALSARFGGPTLEQAFMNCVRLHELHA
ncbi:MAG TPA: ABC transporter ATP-binding protein [Burkholderiales bacterium]|nr:ABC transporter ATP-binding protein [Burkholderiales bacterium]